MVNQALLLGAFLFLISSPIKGDAGHRIVRHVIDGDTVVLANGERVRMIGINAPELASDHRTEEPYSLEARLALREMVEGKPVRLVFDRERNDDYGRTLAYIELADGTDVQHELVARGYAVAIAISPNLNRLHRYIEIEETARESGAGLWSGHTWLFDGDDHPPAPPAGFLVLRGTVSKVDVTPRNVVFKLAGGFTLRVPSDLWDTHWHDKRTGDYPGHRVEARGWSKGNGNWITIHHPLMMRIL